MQTLRMLGSIGLTGSDGAEVDALLRQPKSVALLAYLAMPAPGRWHRRDVLLGTFWPELSQTRARAALRSALHLLRRHLDDDTIRTRGDDDVSLDAERLTTDVAALLDDIAAHAHDRAIARHAGALLPGLYISEAPEFERWLDRERARLNDIAVRAAAALIDEREAAGNLAGATEAARRASELSPHDESIIRRYVALLDQIGDRAGALAVFERFRARISREFGSDPSAATLALIDDLRARTTSRLSLKTSLPPPADDSSAAPLRIEPQPEALHPTESDSGTPAAERQSRVPRRWLVGLGAAAVALLSVAYAARSRSNTTSAAPNAAHTARLVLLPLEGNAVDSANVYLASGIEYGIARRLGRVQMLGVRRATRAESRMRESTVDPEAPLGSTVLVRVTLDTLGDSISMRVSLVDSASRRGQEVLARRIPSSDVRDVESHVASAIVGALHRVGVPFGAYDQSRPVDPEAYRLTVLGYHQLINLTDDTVALTTFVRATALDPLYPRAWSGLASVWGFRTITNAVSLDDGYDRTAAAASRALALDSAQGSALASLGMVTALKYRRLEAGAPFLRRAMVDEPSNPEVFVIASFTNRYLHRWDDARDLIRVARRLDPLSVSIPDNEGRIELCAGRPEAAERVYREAIDADPQNAVARDGLVRALAMQGKFNAALDLWRASPPRKASPALVAVLTKAHGPSGYYDARHLEGRQRLDAYRRAMIGRTVPRLRLVQLQLQAGDSAAGFASLDSAVLERAEWLFRIPCFQSLDEYRSTPRYRALLARVGAMSAR